MRHSTVFKKRLTAENIAKRRKLFNRLHRYLPPPRGVKIESVSRPGFKGEWIRAKSSRPEKVMLFIPGGAFIFNGTKVHRYAISKLTKTAQISTLSVNYSLAPEHPYPAAINEVMKAYKWLLKTGTRPKDIVFVGHSSGANLVLTSILKLRDNGVDLPAAAVAISPPTDGTIQVDEERAISDPLINSSSIKFYLDTYRAKTSVKNPYISPLLADLKGFPPLLLQVGEDEVLYTESLRFAKKAKAAGVKVDLDVGEQMWHGWPMYGSLLPEGRQALQTIAKFIRRRLG